MAKDSTSAADDMQHFRDQKCLKRKEITPFSSIIYSTGIKCMHGGQKYHRIRVKDIVIRKLMFYLYFIKK